MWAAHVLAGMLAYHAAHSKTFPGEHVDFPEGRTPEAWNAYVHGLAQAFEHYITSMGGEDEPIYTDEQMESRCWPPCASSLTTFSICGVNLSNPAIAHCLVAGETLVRRCTVMLADFYQLV